jgi:TPR repeat protein
VKRPYPFIDEDKRFKNNSELYCAEEAVMLLGLLEKGSANPGYVRTLLGQAYDYGWGVEQNYAKAREYYTKGATLGDSWGMTEIGVLTFLGWGGTPDHAKAFSWFRRAMHEGDARGALYAAYCHETGQGTSQDVVAAANLYRQVAGCNNEALVKRARDGLARL